MATIEIVQRTGYLAFLERTKESEECYTHLAQAHSTARGPYLGYVKFYPDDLRNSKGLVNEVCGYLLAHLLNIPLPRSGMILIVESKRLIEAHPSLTNLLPADGEYATWVTEQVVGVPVVAHDHTTLDSLRKWPALSKLIAFDDWVLNSDRSLGNVIYSRRARFTPIDHGHIFGGLRWDHELLTPGLSMRHPFFTDLWDGNPPIEVKSQILEAARAHPAALQKARPELDDLLGKLLGNETDKNQLLAFLERRAAQSYDRIRDSLGMLT